MPIDGGRMIAHTDATVVISLITTLSGAVLPSTVSRAMAGLSPLPLLTGALGHRRPRRL
jgi:hypothetical protein